jgi:signal transduction histidine kinase
MPPGSGRSAAPRERWLALAAAMLHNRRGFGDGDNKLATRRGVSARKRNTVRAGALMAGATGLPLAASAASGGGNAASLLLAVVLGAAVAVAAVILALRARDSRTAEPLQQALSAACAFWWRTDTAGRIVEARAGALANGVNVDAFRGRQLWQPADGAPEAEPLRTAFRDGRPFTAVPFRLDAPTGIALSLSGGPVRSPSGALLGYAGIAQPSAAQAVGGGAERGSLRADLEERNRQLGERTRDLDNAVRELDSFAYSVSHDLRAPLRVVDGFATIVLEDYGDRGKPLDDVGRDHLRRIVAASQRMNTMIDTLLGLSRMTSRELARERVDLSQIARELTDDLRAQDGGRAVDFVVAPELRTDGDSTLLRLVLQNLLGNAYKFTGKNRMARVEFGARADGSGLAYFVKDNGAGFDMRFAEKMFGLFQRLHSANEFPGTGVGLATVQKIIRRHGGRIWAEAVPAPNEGHGATFYFTLWEKQ